MLFTHSLFLFYFLPAVLLAHRCVVGKPGKPYRGAARLFLFAATLVFYGWQNPWWLIPLFISIGFDFLWAGVIHRRKGPVRKLALGFSVIQNLLLLGFFKYWNAIAIGLHSVFPSLSLPTHTLGLPPGISFYTFESLSFVIDVYRRQVRPPRSALEFFAFIGMFPRFIAGPIVRYRDMRQQFEKYAGMQVERGFALFGLGLSLKVAFADSFAIFVPYAFGSRELCFWHAWLGTLSYTFQIYFDFSGYSLMAIGLGQCLGFRFPQNFDRPYLASSLQEFWQRWHITLSTWLRDYLYIPLGGSRKGAGRTYRNLIITFALGGLWHGAGLGYLVWGLWHGVWLAAERACPWHLPERLRQPKTFFVATLGWVFFRAASLPEALTIGQALIVPSPLGTFNAEAIHAHPLSAALCLLGLGYAFLIEPRFSEYRWAFSMRPLRGLSVRQWATALFGYATALLLLLSAWRVPFLYFQF